MKKFKITFPTQVRNRGRWDEPVGLRINATADGVAPDVQDAKEEPELIVTAVERQDLYAQFIEALNSHEYIGLNTIDGGLLFLRPDHYGEIKITPVD